MQLERIIFISCVLVALIKLQLLLDAYLKVEDYPGRVKVGP